ncbi:DUF4304 domain-containing protein [Myroides sp. C15-4]|uniref:DUF4304 domain-containing protein n=1 Tax=Myroides sp. C15-4 TaxID=3400532 RepID=UPI003D2F9B9F
MNSKEFKKTFSKTAQDHGFEDVFGAWFKVSTESIVVLELQKSNFGDYYEMNIKVYIQGIFGTSYSKSKELVRDTGDIFIRQPAEYKSVFDFDELMEDEKRKGKLEQLFSEFIIPFTGKALSKSGIKELAEKGEITLLPAVKDELIC